MPGIEQRVNKRSGETRYVVRVRNPDKIGGKGFYTSATFATEAEAKTFVRDCDDRGVSWALEEYHRGQEEAAEMTLDDWSEQHFTSLTKANPATIADYRRIYKAKWSPTLGRMRLSSIGRVHVAQALNSLDGSDKTRMNAWAVLTHMLKVAAQDGHISKSPTVGVELDRRTDHMREEHRYLTEAEFFAILAALPEHWRPLVMTLGGTGMRWGEAAALTVADVDLTAAVVRITKAERRGAERRKDTTIGPTKTRRSRRTVTLPNEVVDALGPLVRDRKAKDPLFLPPKGGPLRHRRFYQVWQAAIVKAKIADPAPRLHDLRHSHVAWLIARGVPLPVIQARLGHENISTTIDTYGHLMPDLQQAAADAASQVFIMGAQPKELG
ncbi:tyrosine-type recombinase/integrase [Nocardioides sp. BYT-33-1]|uniref:tyrosine-type recombinase/integrase n=1 Tax=Nocardioides sp. BYT-33-1 TaxID=3416952 RepID=UPI003F53A3D4